MVNKGLLCSVMWPSPERCSFKAVPDQRPVSQSVADLVPIGRVYSSQDFNTTLTVLPKSREFLRLIVPLLRSSRLFTSTFNACIHWINCQHSPSLLSLVGIIGILVFFFSNTGPPSYS